MVKPMVMTGVTTAPAQGKTWRMGRSRWQVTTQVTIGGHDVGGHDDGDDGGHNGACAGQTVADGEVTTAGHDAGRDLRSRRRWSRRWSRRGSRRRPRRANRGGWGGHDGRSRRRSRLEVTTWMVTTEVTTGVTTLPAPGKTWLMGGHDGRSRWFETVAKTCALFLLIISSYCVAGTHITNTLD